MAYIITFMEGILSFISPCLLPLLPVYVSFFMGSKAEKKRSRTVVNSIFFVLGFSVVFSSLGVFAGTLSLFLSEYRTILNLVCGILVILFGLSYLGVFNIPFPGRNKSNIEISGILSAFLFGVIYSISLTPCVGAFLGSALAMASSSGSSLKGLLLLVTYSAGMGLPFVLSAVLINETKEIFGFIKKHYSIIVKISGIFLIAIGILMASGLLSRFAALFTN